MNFLTNIFWNGDQNRLRTGYRIISLLVIYIVIGKGLQFLIGSFAPEVKFSSTAPLWFFMLFAGIKFSSGTLSVWLAGHFWDRRFFKEFGFYLNKRWWIDFCFGLGLGVLLMLIIFIVQYYMGWIEITDVFFILNPQDLFILPILVFFFVFIWVAISEEIVTRGYLLINLAEGLNFKAIGPKGAIIIGWILSSAIFGFAHMDHPNATWISTINIITGGMFLGIGYVMTGQLAIPIGVHLTWNFFQSNIFGFPVSGFTIPSDVVAIIKVDQVGPELWTGGAFGPEAGLLGLGAIILGSVLIFGWLRFRYGMIRFHLPIANFLNKKIIYKQ